MEVSLQPLLESLCQVIEINLKTSDPGEDPALMSVNVNAELGSCNI